MASTTDPWRLKMAKILEWILLPACLLVVSGCVIEPTNDDESCAPSIQIKGYAWGGNSEVTFHAYDFAHDEWDLVGSATSGSTKYGLCDECYGYYYSGEAIMDNNDYLRHDGYGNYFRTIRVFEGDIRLNTFDRGGPECMATETCMNHKNCLEAWITCKGDLENYLKIWCRP
jgi:hypothetical protein